VPRLEAALEHLAARGDHLDPDVMVERVRRRLDEPVPVAAPPPRRIHPAAVAAALLAVVLGGASLTWWLLDGGHDVAGPGQQRIEIEVTHDTREFPEPPPVTFDASGPALAAGTFCEAGLVEEVGAFDDAGRLMTDPQEIADYFGDKGLVFDARVRRRLVCDDGSGALVIESRSRVDIREFERAIESGGTITGHSTWSVVAGEGAYDTVVGGGSETWHGGEKSNDHTLHGILERTGR
jgi:hypothetical protein